MTEKRRAARTKCFLRGYVYVGNSSSAIECVVRDISGTGARLKCSGPISTADVIDLHIPIRGQTLRATIQWRKANEIGVAFVSGAAMSGAPSGEGDLSDRMARIEAEMAALTKLIRRLQNNTDRKAEAA
jgi:hypothetical protein